MLLHIIINRNLIMLTGNKMKNAMYSVVILSLMILTHTMEAHADYSNGWRFGEIIKLSEKGWVNKSFEGQMMMGANSTPWAIITPDGDGGHTETLKNPWAFSITDQAIANQVNAKLGDYAVLKYTQSHIHNPLATDTDYDIVEVHNIAEPRTEVCVAESYESGMKSKGIRVGRITKASRKGTIIDSFEIIVQVGDAGNNFHELSISKDEKLYQCAINYLKAGQKVKVHYSQSFINLGISNDSSYDVVKIEPIVKARLN